MKKPLIAFIFILAAIWRPATDSIGQQKQPQSKNPVVEKDKQKQALLQQVDKAQDSTLQLLNRKKPAPPVKIIIRSRPVYKPVDTLIVKGTTITSKVDTLYEDMYYLIPDTSSAKKRKRNLWQKIFGRKREV